MGTLGMEIFQSYRSRSGSAPIDGLFPWMAAGQTQTASGCGVSPARAEHQCHSCQPPGVPHPQPPGTPPGTCQKSDLLKPHPLLLGTGSNWKCHAAVQCQKGNVNKSRKSPPRPLFQYQIKQKITPTPPILISDKDRIWFHFKTQTLQKKKLSCKFSSNLNFTREALAILSNPFAFATCNYSAGNFTRFRDLNFSSTFHPEMSPSAAAITGVSSRLSPGILQSVFASFHSCDISAQVIPRLWRLRDLSLPRSQ